MSAHVNDTFQAEFRTNSGRRHPVLSRTSFSDDPSLTHATCQNDLAQHIVNLMSSRVIKLIAFEIHLRAAKMFGQAIRIVKRTGAANIIGPKILHLSPKTIVCFGKLILCLKI